MRFFISALGLTFLVTLGSPAGARDELAPSLSGAVEKIDRLRRTLVVEGVRVKVPRKIRGFRGLRTGEPVFVELEPGIKPARAARIEPVAY